MPQQITRSQIRTYVRIHLNTNAGSWQFYDPLDLTTLNSHYGNRRSIIVFRPQNGGPPVFNDDAWVEDGTGYVKTAFPVLLELNRSYYVDLFDYQSRQWTVEDVNVPPGEHAIVASLFGTYTTTTSTEVLDDGTILTTTTYHIDPSTPLLLEVYPELDPPSLTDFQNLSLSLNFDQVIDDSANSTGWASAYNAGNSYWVNGTNWGIQWVNVQTGINGNVLHPSINLYWCVTDVHESLSAQQIYDRSQLIPTGKGDYRAFMRAGNTYPPNPGAEQNGYVNLQLKDIYCPQGVYTPNTFQGRGKLHLVMGMDGAPYTDWKVTTVDIYHEPEVASGTLTATVAESDSRQATLTLSGYITDPANAVSSIHTRYRVNSGNWIEMPGYATTLQVTDLVANQNSTIDVEVSYMNLWTNSSTYQVNVRTLPEISNLLFTLTPSPQPAGDTLYSLTLTAQHNNSGSVEFAFLRDDTLRDYPTLDLTSLGLTHFVDFQPSNTHTFTNLLEGDIEGYYWVVLVRDTADTSQVSWTYLHTTEQTITGRNSSTPSTSEGVTLTIPKEHSNRYVKDLTMNNVEAGLVEFDSHSSVQRSYYTGHRMVSSIALEVEDAIPAVFSGSRENYISYHLHIDGVSYPITPLNRNGNHPVIYHINLPVPADERQLRRALREEFIDLNRSVNSFQIEARLSGDANYPYLTPVIYSWRVRAVVVPMDKLHLTNTLINRVTGNDVTT